MRPTRANRLRKEAEKFSASEANELSGLKGYDLILTQLNTHKRQLKQIQSMERKADFKRSIFPEYQPWIDGTLQAGTGVQDGVLMQWLVWSIDINDLDYALKIAEYALFHDLVLPERFQRTLATTVVEEFANVAKRARESQKPFELSYLIKANELTADHDMPDEVKAKLLREMGELEKESEPETALAHFKRALELDSQISVKVAITKLEKQLEKQLEKAQTEPSSVE